jgi:superfamily I DNA/RNA helicase
MIYPEQFPLEKENEHAEKAVFERLKSLEDSHDIFYSKRFVNNTRRKSEFEIDFIIAKPNKYVIVLEVKGGLMQFDGFQWTQNGKILHKNPELQVTYSCHALVKKYSQLSKAVPFIWMLCFPDCELPDNTKLPPSLTPFHILDRSGLYDVKKTLRLCLEHRAIIQNDVRIRDYVYGNFKTDLLRDIGFVKTLGTSIRYQEEKFVDLTTTQLGLIDAITENRKIIIHGAAGTGKTIVAKHMAMKLFDADESVLFLCFNRLLANKIREGLNIRKVEKERFQVTTFHSIARDIITQSDPEWWEVNSRSEDEFWSLEVPSKMDEVLDSIEIEKYDTIIIDEGQDFKEFWFDVLFKLCKPDARKYIFLDSMQNIFGHYSEVPNADSFFRYRLTDNLRNTKSIVRYINKTVETNVKASSTSPDGEEVVEINSKNSVELIKNLKDLIEDLIINQKLQTSQLLILISGSKVDSPIATVKKIENFPLKSIDRKARFEKNTIHYTNIKTFKGLEQDVLIILNDIPHTNSNYQKLFYTQASRAKHGLYILNSSS